MYLRCEGEGAPLVVFESGFGPGGDSQMWREVLPLVARETQACAYDRVGQGRSSRPVPHPHSMRQMARELRALLDAAKQLRQALRMEFDALSSNAVHVVAERSGHLVPLEQAQLVTDAALAVVEAARSGRLLSQLPFP
jgi:pimeloyl-ACP methyl ester carboxylesterase